jgi:hypothetical protein
MSARSILNFCRALYRPVHHMYHLHRNRNTIIFDNVACAMGHSMNSCPARNDRLVQSINRCNFYTANYLCFTYIVSLLEFRYILSFPYHTKAYKILLLLEKPVLLREICHHASTLERLRWSMCACETNTMSSGYIINIKPASILLITTAAITSSNSGSTIITLSST